MKNIIATAIGSLVAVLSFAQPNDPVHWTFTYKKLSAKTGELHAVAIIEEPWHIYAQVQPKEAVGEPTQFVLKTNPLIKVAGKWKELGKKETYHNEEVGITQYHYGKQVEFVQPVLLKASIKTMLTGTVRYQACTDERCLPSKTVPFTIALQ